MIRESCKEIGWQSRLIRHLKEGLEVELVSLNCEYDGQFCHELAQKFDMHFEADAKNQYGTFRKN